MKPCSYFHRTAGNVKQTPFKEIWENSEIFNDLRNFTTPEMFAAIKLDLQERAGRAQRTDVVRVDAEVLDVASEAERQVVSVRFHGLIR